MNDTYGKAARQTMGKIVLARLATERARADTQSHPLCGRPAIDYCLD
jgi:hypothetical protein